MRITNRVHALRIPFTVPVAPGKAMERFVHLYPLLGERVAMIDAGVSGVVRLVDEWLASQGRHVEELDLVALTHAHPDHMGGLQGLRRASGCEVAAHAEAVAWIEDVDLQQRERPVPGFNGLVEGPITVDRVLADGDRLELPGLGTLTAVLTPGHEKGHLAYWLEEEGLLFSGDALPVPGEPPVYSDVAVLRASVERLKALKPRWLLSSWDEPRAGGEAVEVMAAGLAWVDRVGDAVARAHAEQPEADAPTLFPTVCARLSLPPLPPAPVLVAAVAAHLRELGREPGRELGR